MPSVKSVRWMVHRDIPEVLKIENEVFTGFLRFDKEYLLGILKQKNIIGMVAEIDNKILAYMIYEFDNIKINVIKFAITEGQHQIANDMIEKLKIKLENQKKDYLDFCVSESNLAIQLFLKQHGFLAVKIIHADSEDRYLMRFSKKISSDYKNRIKSSVSSFLE